MEVRKRFLFLFLLAILVNISFIPEKVAAPNIFVNDFVPPAGTHLVKELQSNGVQLHYYTLNR